MEESDELLCNIIINYPHLFNNTKISSVKRISSLSEIASEMSRIIGIQLTAEDVGKKWRNLRSTFGKVDLKVKLRKKLSKKHETLYKQLYFLNDYIQHKVETVEIENEEETTHNVCKMEQDETSVNVSEESNDFQKQIHFPKEELQQQVQQQLDVDNSEAEDQENDEQPDTNYSLQDIRNKIKGKASKNVVMKRKIKEPVRNAMSDLNSAIENMKRNEIVQQYAQTMNQHLQEVKENKVQVLIDILQIIEKYKN